MTTCFHIQAFQADAYADDLEDLEAGFTDFWAGLTFPARLISRTTPLNVAPRREALRARLDPLEDARMVLPFIEAARNAPSDATRQSLAAFCQRRHDTLHAVVHPGEARAALRALQDGADDDVILARLDSAWRAALWRWRWLKEQQMQIDQCTRQRPPLCIEHYMLTWPDRSVHVDALRERMLTTTLVPDVTLAPLPPLFQGQYRPQATHLEPVRPGDPYMCVLTAYDVRGTWDLLTWQRLLMLDIELTLSVDVLTLASARMEQRVEDAATMLESALGGVRRDTRSKRAWESAEYALSVLDIESLHEVHYAVLVQAPTLSRLNQHVQRVSEALGRRLRFDRVAGAQEAYLTLFTDQPARRVIEPLVRRNTTSHGVAVVTPWGIRKGSTLAGPEWGIDAHTHMPVHHEIFGEDGRQNASGLIVGVPGAGKTVGTYAHALRHAAEGFQIILMEPANTCWRLRDAIGNERAVAYYDLSRTPAINMLDPVATEPAAQRDQIVRKLEVALGKAIDVGGRTRIQPRLLTNIEAGILDQVIRHDRLYGPDCQTLAGLTPATAPLLEDLVAVLYELGREDERPEALALAEEIAGVLLGTAAAIYNRPTQLHCDFSADVILYSFQGAAPGTLPIIYDYLFELVNRYVWSTSRDIWTRPLLFYMDEFYYMASVRSLELHAAKAVKTWRNRRGGFWPIDQNVETFFGATGNPEEASALMVSNMRHRLLYRLEGTSTDILANAYKDVLSPQHIRQIKRFQRGQCLAMLDDRVHTLDIALSALEYQYLVQQQQPSEQRRTT